MHDTERPAEDRSQILEIYKLHVEMADHVSQRREGANRLFVAILSAMTVLIAAALRFAPDSGVLSAKIIVVGVALTGLLLTMAWFAIIMSYRQLNSGKFHTLQELEKKLPFAFYTMEWKKMQHGKNFRVYWKLTVVEGFPPIIFFGLFLMIIGLIALTS